MSWNRGSREGSPRYGLPAMEPGAGWPARGRTGKVRYPLMLNLTDASSTARHGIEGLDDLPVQGRKNRAGKFPEAGHLG